MNYIEDEQELEELHRIANLFKAQSVEEFCCEKLAKFAPRASSSSEGSASDWVVLVNAEVDEETSPASTTPDPPKFPDQIVEVSAKDTWPGNDGVPQTPGKSEFSV